jgi:hypothetical protein
VRTWSPWVEKRRLLPTSRTYLEQSEKRVNAICSACCKKLGRICASVQLGVLLSLAVRGGVDRRSQSVCSVLPCMPLTKI